MLQRVRSPFDFCAFHRSLAVVFDAKTVDGHTFCHSDITQHQVASLIHCRRDVCAAGYVVWFRETSRVIFFSAMQLYRLRRGESLSAADGLDLGTHHWIRLRDLFRTSPLTPPPEVPTE